MSDEARRLRLAVDFDGTLAMWDMEEPSNHDFTWLDGGKDFLELCGQMGTEVIIHSCRTTWPRGGLHHSIAKWLGKEGFNVLTVTCEYDDDELGYQRQNWEMYPDVGYTSDRPSIGIWIGEGKPIADFYIDDRGITFDPAKGWQAVIDHIAEFGQRRH